jgi:hypothetical protein
MAHPEMHEINRSQKSGVRSQKIKRRVERMCLHWLIALTLAAIQSSGYMKFLGFYSDSRLLTPVFGTVSRNLLEVVE